MNTKYPILMKVFHWVMAAMILTLIAVGMWMTGLPKDMPEKGYYYGMHKSFGLIVLALVFLRLVNRAVSSPNIPDLPNQINKFDANLSKLTHLSLYLLMLMQPMSGFLMGDFGGRDIMFFSYQLPHIFTPNQGLSTLFWQMHGYIGYAFVALIFLHVAGAFKHYFRERVNLFARMW